MITSQARFLAALSAVSLFSASLADAQNMFRGDPSHSAVITDKAPADFSRPFWSFKTKGPVISSVVVDNGAAYFGSDDRNLYAVDAATGAKKWTFGTDGQIRSTPAVSDGAVFFISYDSKVYSLDAATGAKKWEYLTAGDRRFEAKNLHGCVPATQTMPDFWDVYESSPAVVDGVAYVGAADGLYALDANTGALLWKCTTGDVVHSSPAVVGGVVYFGSWDTFFYALDAKTGAEKWRFKTGDDPQTSNHKGIQSSPVVKDGIVYFGCRDARLYALDAATGAKKWEFDNNGGWINCTPLVTEGTVWFVTSIPSLFIALDAATGEVKMKGEVPFALFSSPVIAGDKVYAGAFDGCLYSCNVKDGKVTREFSTQAAINSRSLLFKEDGSVNYGAAFFRNNDFEEMYFTAGKIHEAGAIMASPVVVNGELFVGSSDGSVYCFR